MEQMVNELNIEAGAFLRFLHGYVNNKNVVVGKKSIGLLLKVVSIIDDLVQGTPQTDLANEIDVDFLNGLDEQHYGLRRYIMCRLCADLIPMSKEDLESHKRKSSHLSHVGHSNIYAVTQNTLAIPSPINLKPHQWQGIAAIDGSNTNMYHSPESRQTIDSTKRSGNFSKVFKQNDDSQKATKNSIVARSQKSDSKEQFFDWQWHRATSDASDSASPEPEIDFNCDSKYLIEVAGLPWSATREEISTFFKDIKILNGFNGIQFILESNNGSGGRAFVQIENLKDFQSALKRNLKSMDGRPINVSIGDIKHFKKLLAERKIPSKERVVMVDQIPQNYDEQYVRKFFHNILIEDILMIRNDLKASTHKAFVKFATVEDVESAIKRKSTTNQVRVYRSSKHQMQSGIVPTFQNPSRLSTQMSTPPPPEDVTPLKKWQLNHGSSNESLNGSPKYLQVRGLPFTEDKTHILGLFPGLRIDRNNGIQMEYDAKHRFTGKAIVEFKNVHDFKIASKADLTAVSKYIKVGQATKDDFVFVEAANKATKMKNAN